MINRRDFLRTTAAAMALGPSLSLAGGQTRNILFIMVDDLLSLGYRFDFGPEIVMPNLLRLQSQGACFENAFAAEAICNISRSSILTGRNPYKHGVRSNSTAWQNKWDPRSSFLGILADAGYRNFNYGKISHGDDGSPWLDKGVCEEVISPKRTGNVDQSIANLAMDRLTRLSSSTRPWCVSVGFRLPHSPLGETMEHAALYPKSGIIVPDYQGDRIAEACLPPTNDGIPRYQRWDQVADKKDYIQKYLVDCTGMDKQLGRLMRHVDDTLRLDCTVILCSDHGYHLGTKGVDTKWTLWDEAGRSPLVVRLPGVAPRIISEPVSLLDVPATILERAGLVPPPRFDGESLLPYAKGLATPSRGALTSMLGSYSLRTSEYRIAKYECGDLELFDLWNDPASLHNVAFEPGYETITNDLLSELMTRVTAWQS